MVSGSFRPLISIAVAILFSVFQSFVSYAQDACLDTPHDVQGCLSCHFASAFDAPNLIPGGCDSVYVGVCEGCHNGVTLSHLSGLPLPNMLAHSSANTSTQYGNWFVGCKVCHNQHKQEQDIAYGTTYGKFIQVKIDLEEIKDCEDGPPLKSGKKQVKFLRRTGQNSFADSDNVYDGICQVCHTRTNHFRNTGEVNVTPDGYDHTGTVGTNCMVCHNHSNGFTHSDGSGTGCVQCHGHDFGTLFDPDMTAPYAAGETASQGRGTYQSHSTHTELTGDDLKGPGIYCDTCHDITSFPYFNSGVDSNGDGRIDLSETDVCDACHSPGGTYPDIGLTDPLTDPVVGAKAIWRGGAYVSTDDSTLQVGKEKWCATCHDESPAMIGGIPAPNVIGDEDAVPSADTDDPDHYPYGDIEPGWGYYKTGHGLEAGRNFPSKGGVETLSGRPVECDSCHDYASSHIDGESRSYEDGDVQGLDPATYRQGYRLKMISGQEPMRIPKPVNSGNTVDHYRVCFQIGCHNFGPEYTDANNMDTNMVTDGVNRHAYHLNANHVVFAGDWSGNWNSRMTCVSCHNVHGSTQLAMVRDGKLVNSQPGQEIWYKNDAITYIGTNSTVPPIPDDLPLSASDGKAWNPASSINLCSHCHPINGFTATNDRDPFQDVNQAPVLEWTGTTNLENDGVAPDSGAGNTLFTFRVAYRDINNDSPSPIEVWVDLDDDDDGTYEVGERFVMDEADTMDTNLVDGKVFTKELTIARAGDGVLNYRFYASDGVLDASGVPTADKTLTVLNNPPVLAWTDEDNFAGDGVNPDTGGDDQDYEFRVVYSDIDNDSPDTIQVLIDRNDDGDYLDAGEQQGMSKVGGTSDYINGEIYAVTLNLDNDLSITGDTVHTYRFQADDGTVDAVGSPTLDSTVTVLADANNPPFLDWVDGFCRTEGVKPAYGAIDTDFEFYVKYTDPDGDCPSTTGFVRVTVDGIAYDMGAVDGDSDCSDGKLYSYTTSLTAVGTFNYSFSAQDDGGAGAYGDPTLTSTYEVEVADALKVRPGGGSGWYSSIQAAVDAVNNTHTVLVYDGTYNEDIEFDRFNDNNTVVRSVCGPDTTIIDGSGSVSTVTFTRNVGNLLDGFQITGGTIGVYVSGSQTTINNCKIQGNSNSGVYAGQNGSYPILTLTNSEVYNNTSDRGAGVRIWRGTGHVIDNTVIRNNTTTGDSLADGGGGLHIFQVNEATISNSVIENNESVNYSGGGLFVSQVPDDYALNSGLTIEDSIIRDNTTNKNGGGVLSDLSKIYFIRSSITGNTAEDDGGFPYVGGGAYSQPSASNFASFVNCIVADNQSKQAGMAYLNGGDLDIINSTIANNRATLVTGGAIYSNPDADPATITIRNSILWGNQAATHGHIGTFSNGPVTITDSVLQTGDDGDFVNAPFFVGSVVPTVSGFASEADPWFVGGGNYHIRAFSPAVDNGNAAYAPDDDFDGDCRSDGDCTAGPEATPDIGADEYIP